MLKMHDAKVLPNLITIYLMLEFRTMSNMKCRQIFNFLAVCFGNILGAVSYSIPNPIYPPEVGIARNFYNLPT